MNADLIKCIIGIIVIFAIIGFVFNLFGGDDSTKIDIDGVKFHIPEYYYPDEVSNYAQSKLPKTIYGYDVTYRAYSDTYGDTLLIAVADLEGFDENQAYDNMVNAGHQEKNIHGKNGFLDDNGDSYLFTYIQNGKYVGISADSVGTIDKVID